MAYGTLSPTVLDDLGAEIRAICIECPNSLLRFSIKRVRRALQDMLSIIKRNVIPVDMRINSEFNFNCKTDLFYLIPAK